MDDGQDDWRAVQNWRVGMKTRALRENRQSITSRHKAARIAAAWHRRDRIARRVFPMPMPRG